MYYIKTVSHTARLPPVITKEEFNNLSTADKQLYRQMNEQDLEDYLETNII